MKKYIELSEDFEMNGMDWKVKFIDEGESWATQFMEFTEYCSNYVPNHKIPTIRQFFKFFEKEDIDKNIIIEFWENEEYFDYNTEDLELDYDTCKKEMMTYYHKSVDFEEFLDRIEDYLNNETLFIDFPLFCGYNAGIVGYSDWTYYIAPYDINEDFVRDLWEGWNFYDIAILNDTGEVVDSVCECYISNNEELEDCIKCNFGIEKEDIKLIDNECSRYFDFKKYKMIPASYNFMEVK